MHFGTEELKRKYLPALCKGEKISAYALSEAGSGSDALAAKATAVRSPDGKHWRLRGEKMWITNAAFADVFVTFAQVDGSEFSAFLVEGNSPGVSTGAEERKMGLKGSSTRSLLLEDAVGHAQPEPGPLPDRLGGEERLEDPRQHLGRDAGAVTAGPQCGLGARRICRRLVLVRYHPVPADARPLGRLGTESVAHTWRRTARTRVALWP